MKLFVVDVDLQLMVAAEDEIDAEEVAFLNLREESRNALLHCTEVRRVADLPHDFKGTIPWGEEDDRTVEEIAAEIEEHDKIQAEIADAEKRQQKIPGAR